MKPPAAALRDAAAPQQPDSVSRRRRRFVGVIVDQDGASRRRPVHDSRRSSSLTSVTLNDTRSKPLVNRRTSSSERRASPWTTDQALQWPLSCSRSLVVDPGRVPRPGRRARRTYRLQYRAGHQRASARDQVLAGAPSRRRTSRSAQPPSVADSPCSHPRLPRTSPGPRSPGPRPGRRRRPGPAGRYRRGLAEALAGVEPVAVAPLALAAQGAHGSPRLSQVFSETRPQPRPATGSSARRPGWWRGARDLAEASSQPTGRITTTLTRVGGALAGRRVAPTVDRAAPTPSLAPPVEPLPRQPRGRHPRRMPLYRRLTMPARWCVAGALAQRAVVEQRHEGGRAARPVLPGRAARRRVPRRRDDLFVAASVAPRPRSHRRRFSSIVPAAQVVVAELISRWRRADHRGGEPRPATPYS